MTKKKTIAIYCRVSSDAQKKNDTIENQIETLNSYVDFKENLDIYDKYLDDGTTGTLMLEERHEGKRLIEDARNNKFEAVLVWKVDRFGRDTLSGLQAAEILIKLGIEIISVTEPFDLNTPTGRFQFINYLNMAELERNNILDRMFIGATRAVKKGKWLGGIVPYGYFKNKDGYLEISNEKMDCGYSEREVIELIFNSYLDKNMSAISIAAYLNSLNIPTSCGSGKGKRTKNISDKWRPSSILRILDSTTYKGIHEYGKRASRRKETILRKVPAIIDEDTWNKVQLEKENKKAKCSRNTKHEFLLRGLIECGKCNKKYYGISYKSGKSYYVCSSKRQEIKKILGYKCDNINIPTDLIENFVWNDCIEILNNPAKYLDEFRKENKCDNSISDDIEKINKSLENLNKEKNNILKLYRKEIISETDLENQMKEINEEEKVLSNLLTNFKNQLCLLEDKEQLADSIESKLNYYHNRIKSLTFIEKSDIVNMLVKKIVINSKTIDGVEVPVFDVTYSIFKLDT
ncbi:recombinase family protein [Clostridium cadaveris]|uniref:recombinase family protein n=1 Tax=Clostridium cadaveris TaxID=1529 RepID=UPI0015B424B8|nr:recombinase family protein [Clostridium cadaveris]